MHCTLKQDSRDVEDTLTKVRSARICGTGLRFLHLGLRFSGQPMALGHEYAGDVIDVGIRYLASRGQ